MEADCQDEQHKVAHNAVQRTRMNDAGSIQFLSTRYVTPQGSNSGYTHPLCPQCLWGDKGGNLG